MGDFQQQECSGALFKNDKNGNEKRPDYTGNCLIGGVVYKIGAWLKKDKNGKTFMSMNFQSGNGRGDGEQRPAQRQEQPDHDDIAFT